MKKTVAIALFAGSFGLAWAGGVWAEQDSSARRLPGETEWWKPYSPPCTERENVFAFTEKPAVKNLGNDKYEITFAVKGNCDVTVGLVDSAGILVRHLGSGVLGANAPAPFQKNSLKQTIYWNGKDDLDVYHKTPEKLRVRVMLGLKPEFDKRLGVTNPKSIPGFYAWGLACDESGVYVAAGFQHARGGRIRKFDHDGNYVGTVNPPPANLPPEKLQGMAFVEYEPGRKALHQPGFESVWGEHSFLPSALPHSMPMSCQFAIVGGRIYYCTKVAPFNGGPSLLHYIGTDGSTDLKGATGRPFLNANLWWVFLAASPDGKWLYVTGDPSEGWGDKSGNTLFRRSLESEKLGEVLVGEVGKPGSDNNHFQATKGLDCDAQGRIYVCDSGNNRIQVFAPDGKHAKTISIERPSQIKVHRKSGALYVHHKTRVQGKTVDRLCKLTSYDNPAVELYADVPSPGLMALDSWTAKPRLWLFGEGDIGSGFGLRGTDVRIWEEDGKEFRKFADFEEEVKAEVEKAGGKYPGGWIGTNRAGFGKMVCDPVRERACFTDDWSVFDLRTGAWLGNIRRPLGIMNDIAFDKRGYMHCHFNPTAPQPGVGRLDPSRPGSGPGGAGYLECPYDYGVEGKDGWLGILPVRDQPGAKFFQDGIGVNMRGDVAENCNIYYAPKRDDDATAFAMAGDKAFTLAGDYQGTGDEQNYQKFLADVQRRQKTGEEIYWIRPKPGVPLLGATIWTFDRNGELRDECAVTAGLLINGVMIDEDGAVYFVNNRTRLFNGKPFLAGQGGIFGAAKDAKAKYPFTGTLIKVGKKASILSTLAPIALDERPARPAELTAMLDGEWRDDPWHESAWIEGAEWVYAGASPIVPGGCSCPTMRCHTDWYKRTFVPEKYRHSIGIVDTAGNLILHIGQYGNFDSGYGPASKIPVGGDGIAFSDARMVSGTDNYLCFSDRGERIVVLKLNYHAEESVGIPSSQ